MPRIFYESTTPIEQFQNVVEPQWNLRPERFVNVYIARTNEIYLNDDALFYSERGRFLDDSLAHELVPFIQVVHQGASSDDGEDLEAEAIEVQTWFRETFLAKGVTPDFCR